MPEIDKCAGGTHGGKGAGGHHIHISGGLDGTLLLDDTDHLLSGNDNDLAGFYFFIDLLVCLVDFIFFHSRKTSWVVRKLRYGLVALIFEVILLWIQDPSHHSSGLTKTLCTNMLK